MTSVYQHNRPRNDILASLETEAFERIKNHMGKTYFYPGVFIFPRGAAENFVIFPISSVISQGIELSKNLSLETNTVDSSGAFPLWGHSKVKRSTWAAMRKEGIAYTIPRESYERIILSSPGATEARLKAARAQILDTSRNAQCILSHRLGKRVCRWLLETSVINGATTTQTKPSQIARSIGASAESVERALSKLQAENIISFNRGVLSIKNITALHEGSCSCLKA